MLTAVHYYRTNIATAALVIVPEILIIITAPN